MINILHITFNMAIGGTEQVIKQIVENVDGECYGCHIVCIDGHVGEWGKQLIERGVAVKSFDRKTGLDFNLLKELKAYIIEHNIAVVHCHQYTPYIYGLLASLRTKASTIFTEHGRFYPDLYKWKRLVLNPLLSLKTGAITSISKATVDALVKFENFPRKKIQVIYNGIAAEIPTSSTSIVLKKELGIEPEVPIIGTISRLDPIKNQLMMIGAFKQAQPFYPDARLLMVGDGPSRELLEQRVMELEINGAVIFTGFKTNPQQYLNIMDIFLLSSLSEGTSMTLLEAMAFSKPCVVTSVGGNPEIVVDDVTGITVANENTSQFSSGIVKLLQNPGLMVTMGKAARHRYEENFTVKAMVDQYQRLYDQLASSS